MKHDQDVIIGQEAICPHGLGRVTEYDVRETPRRVYITIDTYVNNKGNRWSPADVELIDPR